MSYIFFILKLNNLVKYIVIYYNILIFIYLVFYFVDNYFLYIFIY